MSDPIVDEVRRWRMQHTREFGGDLKKIIEDLRRVQEVSGYRIVRRSPKLLPAAERTGVSAGVRGADK